MYSTEGITPFAKVKMKAKASNSGNEHEDRRDDYYGNKMSFLFAAL